ncbi:MAG: hypothetical protein S0880_19235 [Actinomycetota bacterium]|nr:hypothetical protein [Actinomycetota bacterium]
MDREVDMMRWLGRINRPATPQTTIGPLGARDLLDWFRDGIERGWIHVPVWFERSARVVGVESPAERAAQLYLRAPEEPGLAGVIRTAIDHDRCVPSLDAVALATLSLAQASAELADQPEGIEERARQIRRSAGPIKPTAARFDGDLRECSMRIVAGHWLLTGTTRHALTTAFAMSGPLPAPNRIELRLLRPDEIGL